MESRNAGNSERLLCLMSYCAGYFLCQVDTSYIYLGRENISWENTTLDRPLGQECAAFFDRYLM